MIQLEALCKRFKDVQAVDHLTCEFRDGEITALLGPNGSGKTTTLRMLYGLLPPDHGRVCIDTIELARDPLEARRRLGVVPDSRGLYERLTSRENLRYFGRLQGLDEAAIEHNIEQLCRDMDLHDIIDRRTAGFSQGQRVKIAIARAMLATPQNLVLDEASNGLDVMSTRSLRDFLRRQRDEGRCIVFSSHVMQEVAALCDRVVIIAAGRVISTGTPAELLLQTGKANLEEAFISLIGSTEGIMA